MLKRAESICTVLKGGGGEGGGKEEIGDKVLHTFPISLHSWPPWPQHGFAPSKLDNLYVRSIIVHRVHTLILRLYMI